MPFRKYTHCAFNASSFSRGRRWQVGDHLLTENLHISPLYVYLCTHTHTQGLSVSRRGHQIPWNWSYRSLWCGCWKSNLVGSCGTAVNICNWSVSSLPTFLHLYSRGHKQNDWYMTYLSPVTSCNNSPAPFRLIHWQQQNRRLEPTDGKKKLVSSFELYQPRAVWLRINNLPCFLIRFPIYRPRTHHLYRPASPQ